jgi:flagellar biosynthesis protein FlhB
MADKGQKTEQPTPKRLEKARKEGNFPSAKELVAAMQFLAFAGMLAAWSGGWLAQMRQTMRWLLGRAFLIGGSDADLVRLSADVALRVFLPLGAAGGALVVVTLGCSWPQPRWGSASRKPRRISSA